MTVRRKVLLSTLMALAVPLAAFYAVFWGILSREADRYEEMRAAHTVGLVRSVFRNELAALGRNAADYAAWDATCAFVRDGNKKYIEDNLSEGAMRNLRVDAVAFVGQANDFAYVAEPTATPDSASLLAEHLKNLLRSDKNLLCQDEASARTGVLLLPEETLVFATYPILTSEFKGPSLGTLMMVRQLDAAELQRLASIAQCTLTIDRADTANIDDEVRAALDELTSGASLHTNKMDANRLGAYALVRDYRGRPAFVLGTILRRDFHHQFLASIRVFLIAAILLGGVITAIFSFVLDRQVVERLVRLCAFARHVASTNDLTNRAEVTGNDELAALANATNGMLDRLEKHVTDLQQADCDLQRRLAVENLIAAISSRVANAWPQETGDAITACLALLGPFANVDRSYLLAFSSDLHRLSVLQEWCSQGTHPALDRIHEAPIEAFPWIAARILAGEVSDIPRVADLPPEASLEKAEFDAEQILSILIVPVACRGVVVGAVGLDAVRAERQWDANLISLLRVVGENFANAIVQQQADERRRESEEKYRALSENTTDALVRFDRSFRMLYTNPAAAAMFGKAREECLGECLRDIGVPERLAAQWERHVADVFTSGMPFSDCMEMGDPTRPAVYDWRILPELDAAGRVASVLSTSRDVTEQHDLENRLRQSQKIQAVGQLAGGVAHDFNNLLQVILSHADFLGASIAEDDPRHEDVDRIVTASQRAAGLTSQLLTFSRRQTLKTAPLDLNQAVAGLMKMLGRLLGEDIELHVIPGGNLDTVMADQGQVDQVLVNLCVNARDAMPKGGRLTVSTANALFDEAFVKRNGWAKPGRFVCVAVADTGCGMDGETLGRAFEPFFTTKEVGKGTGLGLATVYGIVMQHGGLIDVTTAPDSGATFRVYFPSCEARTAPSVAPAPPPPFDGTETVLLAEDEEMVRQAAVRILGRHGYTVYAAANGEEAVHLFNAHAGEIGIVVLDMIMPGMSGRDALDRIRAIRPDVPCLFCSGYAADILDRSVGARATLLQKPYRPDEMLQCVRDALDTAHDNTAENAL